MQWPFCFLTTRSSVIYLCMALPIVQTCPCGALETGGNGVGFGRIEIKDPSRFEVLRLFKIIFG